MRTSVSPRTAGAAAGLLRTRWLVRAPVWLYRARLGAVFGGRLLMLEHTGRTSGARRYVVLEVVGRQPGRYVVCSGFGGRAQWFRNIQADPRVRVYLASRRPAPATARVLSGPAAAAAVSQYAAAHPRAWSTLKPVLEAALGSRISGDGTGLPMVALELGSGQPGRPAVQCRGAK